MFFENTKDTDFLQTRRKIPRCLFGFFALNRQRAEVVGIRFKLLHLTGDRPRTEVLVRELSLTGAVFSRADLQGQPWDLLRGKTILKKGLLLKLQISIPSAENWTTELSMRVNDFDSENVFCYFDSIQTEGRLQLSQENKDALILWNFSLQDCRNLDLQYQNSHWFHGPFDTNLVWTSETSGLLEYDGILLKWSPHHVQVYKAPASLEELQNYSVLWTRPPLQKVSIGNSWWDRWLKLCEKIETSENSALALHEESLRKFKETMRSLIERRGDGVDVQL